MNNINDNNFIELLKTQSNTSQEDDSQLIAALYKEMRRFANHLMKSENQNHTFQATELVNEAYLKMAGSHNLDWQDKKHFFSAAVVAMRRVLVDYARKKSRHKRIPKSQVISIDELTQSIQSFNENDIIQLDEILSELSLLDSVQAKIVELKFFGGFNEEEVADMLELSKSTVQREWRMARMWLLNKMTQ
ncbi:MAG: ECF-type sigma factor [Marinicella sp.]